MRFRFSMRKLLILPVVLAFSIVWVTWPTRTLEKLRSSIRSGDYTRVNNMVKCVGCSFEHKKTPDYPSGGIYVQKTGWKFWNSCSSKYFLQECEIPERSFADVLIGRSSCKPSPLGRPLFFEFVIERGQITMHYCGP